MEIFILSKKIVINIFCWLIDKLTFLWLKNPKSFFKMKKIIFMMLENF
jgi:hypothetical protein